MNQKITAYLIILQILHKKYISVQKGLPHLRCDSSVWRGQKGGAATMDGWFSWS